MICCSDETFKEAIINFDFAVSLTLLILEKVTAG
jgi:hypothetical protein